MDGLTCYRYVLTAQEAYHRMGDGRDSAKQALRVNGALVIQVVVTK